MDRTLITRLALGGLFLASAAIAVSPAPKLLGPSVWTWEGTTRKTTDVGALRQIVRAPTATLDELEIHVTTLNPGIASHPPHRHANEEIVIIRDGTVEVLSDGAWKRAGPGSIVFNASNSLHALKNVGTTRVTYDVINWKSPGAAK